MSRDITEPWEFIARSNPKVGAWWMHMQRYPEFQGVDILDFMKKQKEQGVYDYKMAIEAGMLPEYQPEHNEMRWDDIGKLENHPNLDNQR